MLRTVIKDFARGLLIVAPVALTGYIVFLVFSTVDGWLRLDGLPTARIPGSGLLVTVAGITLIGMLARTLILRWFFTRLDSVLARVPLIKLLYTSIRDLTGALVGETRRFDRPVAVSLDDGSDLLLLGFLTRENLEPLGLAGRVAVYVPQSYNFAGQLLLVPRERVRPLAADSAAAMKLIVSGGVAGAAPPDAAGGA